MGEFPQLVTPAKPDYLLEPVPIVRDQRGDAVPLREMLDRLGRLSEPSWFVRELIPDEGVALWHGRPRSMKSLTLDDVLLSLAIGDPVALGNHRFAITRRRGVILLSEEDPERVRGSRLRMMLKARGVEAPEGFHLMIRRGLNLETAAGQTVLLEAIENASRTSSVVPEVLAIDPARASMPGFDGGPRDAFVAREFLGRVMRETSIKVAVLVHHDTKPKDGAPDSRSRAERASGGLIFSISDAPVGFERVNDREATAHPSAYKFSGDPKPFRLRFESAGPVGEPFEDFLRVVATELTTEGGKAQAEVRVATFLKDHPWSSTQEIADGLGGKAETWGPVLRDLRERQAVAMVTGNRAKDLGRSPNAKLWGLR